MVIDWARQAAFFGTGHQSVKAAKLWQRLVDEHHPEQSLSVAQTVFDRWPTAETATRLKRAASHRWPDLVDDVLNRLSADPYQAVIFALHGLDDVSLAWRLAHDLGLSSAATWSDLAERYAKIDPAAVLPVHRELVEAELIEAGAQNYRRAARRLATMREIAQRTDDAADVDVFIAELREQHRRRPRLQSEFDRAKLP